MTEPSSIAAIRAALEAGPTPGLPPDSPQGMWEEKVRAANAHAACNPAAMREVLDLIDSQAAEIESLRWTVKDALESLDAGMNADCRATLSAALKETP